MNSKGLLSKAQEKLASYHILNKFSMILTIFSVIFMFQLMIGNFNNKLQEERNKTAELQHTIETVYVPQEKQYEESLRRVATYISESDQYLNIGGSSEHPEYLDTNIFNNIMQEIQGQTFVDFLANVELFFNNRTEYLDTLPSIWPMKYSPLLRVTSSFGKRYNPFTDKIADHEGIDLASVWGAAIIATAPGKIVEHWIYHPVFGKYIIIDHGNGYRSHYAHLSVSFVHEGDIVERGFELGRVGETGQAKGIHVHYAISKWTGEYDEKGDKIYEFIDPIAFLREVVNG